MTLTSLLDAALADCPDPTPLARAQRALAAPWSTVVVGRVGVGKSSLVNRRAGATLPVGLGGVTRAVERVDGWVDTPGIDDPSRAIGVLGEWLDLADAVVWVTDGLQPMTRSERDVVDATLSPGTPLWVVVSRADLVDPSELPSVVERVRALAAPHQPLAVVAADLRRGAPDVGTLEPPGPRRLAQVAGAVRAVRSSLPPPPLSPSALADRWRERVRGAVRAVEDQIGAGALSHPFDAETALAALAPAVVAELEAAAGDPPPTLPQPPPPTPRGLEPWLAGWGGAGAATRAVRAAGARWLADGVLAIQDEWHAGADRAQAAHARLRLERTLDALAQAAAPMTGPRSV